VFVPLSGPEDPIARYRTVIIQRVRLFGIGIPVVFGLIAGLSAVGDWQVVQQFVNSTPFGRTDPQFGLDISFYVFQLPFYRLVLNWLFVGIAISFVVALITHYIFGGIRLTGRNGQVSAAARAQLAILAGVFVLLKAVAVLAGPLRAAVLRAQPAVRRRHVHRPQRGDAGEADHAVHLGHLRRGVLRRRLAAQPAAARHRHRAAGPVQRAGRGGVARGAAAVRRRPQRGAARGAVHRAQHRGHPRRVRHRAGHRHRGRLLGHVRGHAPDVRAETATIPNIRILDPAQLNATFTQLQQRRTFYGFPRTWTSTATPQPTAPARTTSSGCASSTPGASPATRPTGSTGSWSTPTATVSWWPRPTRSTPRSTTPAARAACPAS
jgi:hypothetical protein